MYIVKYPEYKYYTNLELVRNLEKLAKCSEKEIDDIIKGWNDIEAENKRIRDKYDADINSKIDEITKALNSCGLEVRKEVKQGKKKYKGWFQKILKEEIGSYSRGMPDYPHIDRINEKVFGEDFYYGHYPVNLKELWSSLTSHFYRVQKNAERHQKVFQKSLELSKDLNIDVSKCKDDYDLINVVREVMVKQYIKENNLDEYADIHGDVIEGFWEDMN